jgi:hypothetical protein
MLVACFAAENLQVFIFSFVSGTALSQLQALLDDPHRIVSLLGVSAPQQASFFSTYILLLVSLNFLKNIESVRSVRLLSVWLHVARLMLE